MALPHFNNNIPTSSFSNSISIGATGIEITSDFQIHIGDELYDISNIYIGGKDINEILTENRKFKLLSSLVNIMSEELEDMKKQIQELKNDNSK